jgi:tagatose-1,6-bisphosphate aldolase
LGLYAKTTLTPGVNIIASYNEKRKALHVINESEYTIYVSENQNGIKDNGIPVYPFEVLVYDKAEGDATEYAFYAYTDVQVAIRVYEAVG